MVVIRNNVYAHRVAEGRLALNTDESGNSLSSFPSSSGFLRRSGFHHCHFHHQLKARAATALESQCRAFIFPAEKKLLNFHFRKGEADQDVLVVSEIFASTDSM